MRKTNLVAKKLPSVSHTNNALLLYNLVQGVVACDLPTLPTNLYDISWRLRYTTKNIWTSRLRYRRKEENKT